VVVGLQRSHRLFYLVLYAAKLDRLGLRVEQQIGGARVAVARLANAAGADDHQPLAERGRLPVLDRLQSHIAGRRVARPHRIVGVAAKQHQRLIGLLIALGQPLELVNQRHRIPRVEVGSAAHAEHG